MDVRTVCLHEKGATGKNPDDPVGQPVNMNHVIPPAFQLVDRRQVGADTRRQGKGFGRPPQASAERRQRYLIDLMTCATQQLCLDGGYAGDVMDESNASQSAGAREPRRKHPAGCYTGGKTLYWKNDLSVEPWLLAALQVVAVRAAPRAAAGPDRAGPEAVKLGAGDHAGVRS